MQCPTIYLECITWFVKLTADLISSAEIPTGRNARQELKQSNMGCTPDIHPTKLFTGLRLLGRYK